MSLNKYKLRHLEKEGHKGAIRVAKLMSRPDRTIGLILIGNDGYGDDYGIGCKESYTVLEVAEMFGGDIKMLPERKGNRLSADVITKKTVELWWSSKENLKDYIENFEK